MSRAFTPKIVTANALLEGDVIYLTADDRWSRDLAEAELIDDEAHAQLRLLEAETARRVSSAPIWPMRMPGPTGPQPAHFREAFRTKGPSNYAHGKQEDRKHV